MNKKQEADILAKCIFEAITDVAGKVAKKTIKERGIERSYNGLVTYVDNDKKIANVNLGFAEYENLPNKTGENLKIGDGVRIYATSDLLTDMYIGIIVTMRTN